MNAPVEFWFDFSSPYAYLASERIDALAAKHRRGVDWRPMLLGVSFKAAGQRPLVEIPLKGEYSKHDFERSARLMGLPFRLPDPFPVGTVSAARAFLWAKTRHPAEAKALAHAAFRAYFSAGRNISDSAVVLDLATQAGLPRAQVEAGIADPAIKEALRAEVDGAVARGVFGAPFFFVDGEPFWGSDRLDQVERWMVKPW